MIAKETFKVTVQERRYGGAIVIINNSDGTGNIDGGENALLAFLCAVGCALRIKKAKDNIPNG